MSEKRPAMRSDRGDVAAEVERKNAELYHQERLADRSHAADDNLRGHDKTDADSFPTSDPPQPP
jgi:hypothetical protein